MIVTFSPEVCIFRIHLFCDMNIYFYSTNGLIQDFHFQDSNWKVSIRYSAACEIAFEVFTLWKSLQNFTLLQIVPTAFNNELQLTINFVLDYSNFFLSNSDHISEKKFSMCVSPHVSPFLLSLFLW